MDLTRLDDLRTALTLAGITPKKGLGQHFLIDRPSLEAMLTAAAVGPQDTVLEIGPGLGVMTTALTQQAARVVAVEADLALARLLSQDAPTNLTVVAGDFLNFDLTTLPEGYKVVANLPYYLTSKIFRLLMESPNPPAVAALLVQAEVAERVTAAPGQLSILALSVQYYAEAELLTEVERYKFWPAPAVDSAILRLRRRPQPAFAADPNRLFRLIKAGFGERRKQLKNSLAGGLNGSMELVLTCLKQAKLKPTRRAQELTLGEWERLYTAAVGLGLMGE